MLEETLGSETILRWLRQMQDEIRQEQHDGWGNTLDDVIAYVQAAEARITELERERDLLQDVVIRISVPTQYFG